MAGTKKKPTKHRKIRAKVLRVLIRKAYVCPVAAMRGTDERYLVEDMTAIVEELLASGGSR